VLFVTLEGEFEGGADVDREGDGAGDAASMFCMMSGSGETRGVATDGMVQLENISR